jgi:hypothetical protein
VSVLAEVVAASDPLLASSADPEPGPGRFETVVDDPDRLFVLEAVYEGYLLHYSTPRAFRGLDADLRLLAGDSLYALGLARLASIGDLQAVAELTDLIAFSAQAQAQGRPEVADELWLASAARLTDPGARGAAAVGAERLGAQ